MQSSGEVCTTRTHVYLCNFFTPYCKEGYYEPPWRIKNGTPDEVEKEVREKISQFNNEVTEKMIGHLIEYMINTHKPSR